MEKITPEKTHALLEKLAEYVMNEVPTRREMNQRFEGIDQRFEGINQRFEGIDQRFERIALQLDRLQQEKADKADIIEIKQQLDKMMTNMDRVVGNVQISRTEQKAFDAALQRVEKRIDDMEAQNTGYRVRDKDE